MYCTKIKKQNQQRYYQLYTFVTDKQTSPGILPRTLILISVRRRSGSVGHEMAHALYLPLEALLQLIALLMDTYKPADLLQERLCMYTSKNGHFNLFVNWRRVELACSSIAQVCF